MNIIEPNNATTPDAITLTEWHQKQAARENYVLTMCGISIAFGMIAGGITSSLPFAVGLTITAAIMAVVLGPRVPARPAQPERPEQPDADQPRHATAPPINTTARNLSALGLLGLFIGVLIALSALQADTTVAVGLSSTQRVHNIGLMQAQQLQLISGLAIALGGLLMTVLGIARRRA